MVERDKYERRARSLAHSIPPSDFGSARAIQMVAQALREQGAAAEEMAKALGRLLDYPLEMVVRKADIGTAEAALQRWREVSHG